VDGNELVRQLGQLGRDLDEYVTTLGTLEETGVDAECDYRVLAEEHDDALAQNFLSATGIQKEREATARLKAVPSRLVRDDAYRDWKHAQAKVRTQQASIQALHRRIEIGRSMLSREKALMELDKTL
jgi:hypothetical protein